MMEISLASRWVGRGGSDRGGSGRGGSGSGGCGRSGRGESDTTHRSCGRNPENRILLKVFGDLEYGTKVGEGLIECLRVFSVEDEMEAGLHC